MLILSIAIIFFFFIFVEMFVSGQEIVICCVCNKLHQTMSDTCYNLASSILKHLGPLQAPETQFSARKAIFSSSLSENGEVYTPETSCVKRLSVYIKPVNAKLTEVTMFRV